jgi:hypothetical protein
MNTEDWPSSESWFQLLKIGWNVDLIVDDAPRPPKPSDWSSGLLGGLLANPFPPVSAQEEDDAPAESRLKAGSDFLMDNNLPADLEKYLPGISNLGGSRPERLTELRRRLQTFPAYAWLTSKPGFKDAMETTRYWAARGVPKYQGDAVDFKLITAVCFPFLLGERKVSLGYPTRDEIEAAAGDADRLAAFLANSGGLIRTGRMSYGHRDSVEKLAAELRGLLRTKYKKPRETDPVAEEAFAFEVIAGLKQQFDSASPKILSAFLNIVEYTHDEARLKELIQKAESRGVGN